MYQHRFVGHDLCASMEGAEYDITTLISTNFNSVDLAINGNEVAPQILDTTSTPHFRTVHFTQGAAMDLAASSVLAFGIPPEGS